jgi:hypothetical protein
MEGVNGPMMVPVLEPWALLLVGLIGLAFLGIALYGAGAGFAGVVRGIEARVRALRQPSTILREARRYGRHALIAGGVALAMATFTAGLKRDLRLLLIAEPALVLGVAAIGLARPPAGPRSWVLDLMGLPVWFGLAIAAAIGLSALQRDRELRRTIAETRERIAIADKVMDDGYDRAVRAKFWSVHDDQTRRWAQIGLEDARSGLRAAERLAEQAPDGPERRRLLGLRAEFAGQIERYKGFALGLGIGKNP